MKILQAHETEMGTTLRQLLSERGIECRRDTSLPDLTGGFADQVNASLYTYNKKSDGQQLWLIEAEIFTPPDVQWRRSYVIDAQPSEIEMQLIVRTDPATGTELSVTAGTALGPGN